MTKTTKFGAAIIKIHNFYRSIKKLLYVRRSRKLGFISMRKKKSVNRNTPRNEEITELAD